MPSRSLHKKSRYGCTRCKQRRVKCDEQGPCRHCIRRGEECSLAPLTDDSDILSYGDESDSCASLLHLVSRDADGHLTRSTWGQDLFLMSHFITTVSPTISVREDVQRIWPEDVPRDAVRYPFLMHGMLAMSAMHLAATRQDEKQHYATLFHHHLALGIPAFRQAVKNLDDDSSGPCLAMSLLLGSISFASVSDNAPLGVDGTRSPITIDSILDFLIMATGVLSIAHPRGIFSPTPPYNVEIRGHDTVDHSSFALPPDLVAIYVSLHEEARHFCMERTDSTGSASAFGSSPEELFSEPDDFESVIQPLITGLEYLHREVYAHQLRCSAHMLDGTADPESAPIFDHFQLARWGATAPPRFFELLRQRDYASLMVLHRFVDLVSLVEGDSWMMENWSANARAALDGDDYWGALAEQLSYCDMS